MTFSDWAIRNLKPVGFVVALLCLAGALLYPSFPVSILPDVTFPRVVAIAEAADRPTDRMEVSVARPIEEALATIPGVQRIRSSSKRGSSEISVDFVSGTDVIQAEQFVNARINQVRQDLPPETQIEVERLNPSVFPVLGLVLKSKSLSQAELWSLATYSLKPRLSRVSGVARVIVQGGRAPEIRVNLRPGQLAALGISPGDVVASIQAANEIRTVGRLDRQFQQFQITVDGQTASIGEIKNIAVTSRAGQPIRIGQIADVVDSSEDRTTVVSANGSESVLLNLVRQPAANTVSMVDAVNAELAKLRPGLPADVEIAPFYDQSVLVKEAVGGVRDAVLIGAGLSVLILLLFLRDLRATLLTALIIPVTLLITFVLMRISGLTLNLMTLGALAVGIGLVIDDAIVVVEAVFRQFGRTESTAEAVRAASAQIAAPMISSTLTTVVVFLPLSFLSGVSGAFFSALAVTLALALMVSLGLALALSPSLCAAFLQRSNDHGDGRFLLGLLKRYDRVLGWGLRHKWTVWVAMAATVAGTYLLGQQLETGFMPAMDEGAFVLDYYTPVGASLNESDRLLKKVDQILLETPEVTTFSRRTGTELGFAITESNRGDYAVMLKQGRRKNIEEVLKHIRERLGDEAPGLDTEMVQVLQDLIGDLAGSPSPIEVKLFGENKAEVEEIANGLVDDLGKIKGLVEVKSAAVQSGPEIRFVVDEAEAGRRGLTVDSVASQADASLLGTVATQVLRGDRQVPVRVRLPEGARATLEQVENIGIFGPAGRVRLKDVARVEIIPGLTQSSREDQRRVVAVTAQLSGIDLGSAVAKVRKALARRTLPPGVQAVIAGQYQSQQESFSNLLVVLAGAVLLVFTVMLFQFRSFVAPTVILLLMPLSLFGAVAGLALGHVALNVSSFMGVIMLAGIVVKNGILLLDRAQHAAEEIGRAHV